MAPTGSLATEKFAFYEKIIQIYECCITVMIQMVRAISTRLLPFGGSLRHEWGVASLSAKANVILIVLRHLGSRPMSSFDLTVRRRG